MAPEPKETRVSACEPQVTLKEDACIDASGDEASIMTVCVRQPMMELLWKPGMSFVFGCSVARSTATRSSVSQRDCGGRMTDQEWQYRSKLFFDCKPTLISQNITVSRPRQSTCQPYNHAIEMRGVGG